MNMGRNRKEKVVVAMSGGVDSSLAAALLQEQGYEVTGFTMKLVDLPPEYCNQENLKSCCGRKALEDAHKVASLLRIPHYVVDLRKQFEKEVINNFCEEYKKGRTPNPCIRCNQFIKFKWLLKKAQKLDADYLATGHHARVVYDPKRGKYLLKKGKDKEKEQSYFLYVLTQNMLSHILFPIGNLTKKKVRKKAEKLKLPVASKEESQEICFIPDNNYTEFLREKIPESFRPGPIVDVEERFLGQHHGICNFTVGQRRGIGIAASYPLYVVDIRSEDNSVVVGPEEYLYRKKLWASSSHMILEDRIFSGLEVKAKIRYKHQEASARIQKKEDNQVFIEFKRPQRAITPGQSVVFYQGDNVVGGGIIEKSFS